MNFVKFLRAPLLQSVSGYCFWPLGLADLRSIAGYLGPAPVVVWGGALRGGWVAIFRDFCASNSKSFILAAGLGTMLSFGGV